MQEVRVPSLGWENSLEKEMTTLSSILGWEIPRTEALSRLQFMGLQKSRTPLNSTTTETGVRMMGLVLL